MDNNTLRLKLKQRLNKLDSLDFDNIECWQMSEAFNKAQLKWVRAQLKGLNTTRQSEESSRASIDDLQQLLTKVVLDGYPSKSLWQSDEFPADYLAFKRLSATASNCECPDPRRMTIYQAQHADVDVLLADELTKPSFHWAETFATFSSNTTQIYINDEIDLQRVELHFYRLPIPISFDGCISIASGEPTGDIPCEFRDDIAEIILDEAASILAGDMESMNQYQINQNRAAQS